MAYLRGLGASMELMQHPPSSPDLNPLDSGVWAAWEREVQRIIDEDGRPIKNDQQLRGVVLRAWSTLTPEKVRPYIENWRARLQTCAAVNGARFEL